MLLFLPSSTPAFSKWTEKKRINMHEWYPALSRPRCSRCGVCTPTCGLDSAQPLPEHLVGSSRKKQRSFRHNHVCLGFKAGCGLGRVPSCARTRGWHSSNAFHELIGSFRQKSIRAFNWVYWLLTIRWRYARAGANTGSMSNWQAVDKTMTHQVQLLRENCEKTCAFTIRARTSDRLVCISRFFLR